MTLEISIKSHLSFGLINHSSSSILSEEMPQFVSNWKQICFQFCIRGVEGLAYTYLKFWIKLWQASQRVLDTTCTSTCVLLCCLIYMEKTWQALNAPGNQGVRCSVSGFPFQAYVEKHPPYCYSTAWKKTTQKSLIGRWTSGNLPYKPWFKGILSACGRSHSISLAHLLHKNHFQIRLNSFKTHTNNIVHQRNFQCFTICSSIGEFRSDQLLSVWTPLNEVLTSPLRMWFQSSVAYSHSYALTPWHWHLVTLHVMRYEDVK